MINMLLKSGFGTPWPVMLSDGTEIHGELGLNEICKTKCDLKPCKNERSSLIGTKCHLGLTVYEGRIDEGYIRVFGVVGPQYKRDVPKYPFFKNACKGRTVTASEFSSWLNRLKSMASYIKSQQDARMVEALQPLHDVMRLARDVGQMAEQVLNESISEVISDKFSHASPTQKALLKVSSLLVDSFDLLEIYLNPQAASYGQRRSVEIYKLLDKLARIASLARSIEQRPNVRLVGNTRRVYDVYESFKLIPLMLIDNAQKYSRKNSDVIVEVSEFGSSLRISVQSEGAFLTEEEIKLIFERGYRGSVAKKCHPSGMGLGLYVANIVSSAHGFKINVNSIPKDFELNGFKQATNV